MSKLSMERMATALIAVAAIAACAPPDWAVPSPGPSASPDATGVPSSFPIAPRLFVDGDTRGLDSGRGTVADGDTVLTLRIEFYADMDPASVTSAIRARAPQAANFRWPLDGRTLQFDVPAGTETVVIDPTGARSVKGNGAVVPTSWSIDRPTSTIAIYDPVAIARGETAAARTYPLPLVTGPVQLAHDGRTAVVYHQSAGRTAVSVVDLPTGRRTRLPDEISKIASNGARFVWLPDGRLLTLGTHDTIVSTAAGTDLRWLPALVGQQGPVSPQGDRVAVWSYADGSAAIVDLSTGASTSLGRQFLRCSVNGGVSLAWSPDSRTIAISSCAEDMAGSSRTMYIDVATGRTLATTPDVSVLAWLKNGSQLLAHWSAARSDPRRFPDPDLMLLSPNGVALTVPSAHPFAISPDGRWLLDADVSGMKLIGVREGGSYDMPVRTTYISWTPLGELVVSLPTTP